MAEWRNKFATAATGMTVTNSDDYKTALDSEGRLWEFFGYIIPLYEDTQT